MSDENSSAPAQDSPVENESIESSDNSSDVIESGDQIENAEAVLEQAVADGEISVKEAKKMLKELEIKFNGKSEKVSLPFEVPEEHADFMRRHLQMSKMGQTKAQEAAAWERDTMQFINDLKTNPRKVLSNPNLGVDLKAIAAEILEEELANAQKTPEELEREEYKRKLAEYEEKEAQREKEIEQMRKQKIVEDAHAQYDIAMSNAMEKYDIPKTPLAVYEMAHLMSLEIKRGFEPDMEVIAQMVEEKMNGGYSEHMKNLYKKSPEKLKKLLGEDIFESERQARVAKIKKTPVPVKQAAQDVANAEKKKEEPKKKVEYKDFFGI